MRVGSASTGVLLPRMSLPAPDYGGPPITSGGLPLPLADPLVPTHFRRARKGGQLPSSTKASPASWTRLKHPPANPVRFNPLSSLARVCSCSAVEETPSGDPADQCTVARHPLSATSSPHQPAGVRSMFRNQRSRRVKYSPAGSSTTTPTQKHQKKWWTPIRSIRGASVYVKPRSVDVCWCGVGVVRRRA